MCSAAGMATRILTGDVVCGVTSVDDKLFVLLKRDNNQVTVYSIDDYQLLQNLDVPGYEPHDYSYMTSCVRHRCLYMSDPDNRCIHRYELASSAATRWPPISGKPLGLSVTPSCNLLVTCRDPDMLVESSANNGQLVREIALRPGIVNPWHSVQLTTGQRVVCYGENVLDLGVHAAQKFCFKTCVAIKFVDDDDDDDAAVAAAAADDDDVLLPWHLAVDNDTQKIFVVDAFNGSVALYSSKLRFESYVFTERCSNPRRLYLHEETRRLFVGQGKRNPEGCCGVTVIKV